MEWERREIQPLAKWLVVFLYLCIALNKMWCRTGEITRCSIDETKDWKTFAWRMELCYIVVGAIVLQGGWPLFYIEWRWCLWTIIILISKTLWLLVCSFLHYWHSYLRLSDNVLRHRKPPRNFGELGWYSIITFLTRSTPCGRLLFLCLKYSISGSGMQEGYVLDGIKLVLE